ncbi:major facilitator superfamily domain-containing protein [Chiua virens]|nr:major facilitator superfamily domain-containing protein [Chiua virens]
MLNTLRQETLEQNEQRQSNSLDIEHAPVPDDPRAWSTARKTLTLAIVSSASMVAGIATTGQNPANAQIEQVLSASSSDISWSMSIFVLVQGLFPLVWSAISEVKGRKVVYVSSMSLFIIGSAIVATSNSIGLFIGMRALQAVGSSAVMAIAAATLADIYEPHERGTKMGIYYAAPLLGTSAGPFLGGIFAQAFGWRAVFWFALIAGGVVLVSLVIFFKDSFRKERSLLYQNILRARLEHHPSTIGPKRSDTAESSTDYSQSHLSSVGENCRRARRRDNCFADQRYGTIV